jgi:hypothetical protein
MNLIGTNAAHYRYKRMALIGFSVLVMVGTLGLVFHGHLHVYRHLRSVSHRLHHLHAGATALKSPEQLAMSAIAVPERDEASTDASEIEDAPTVQVGVNGDCLASKLQGSSFSVAVTARPVVTEAGQPSPLYGKIYRFPRALLMSNSKREITSVPVDLSELKGQKPDMNNVVLAVSICSENRDSSNCDIAPLAQPFRMAGHYLDATTPSGKLNIQFVSDRNADHCPKI